MAKSDRERTTVRFKPEQIEWMDEVSENRSELLRELVNERIRFCERFGGEKQG